MHHPLGEGANSGYANRLAFEIRDRFDRAVFRDVQREKRRSIRQCGNSDCGDALRNECEFRAGSESDIYTSGGQALLQLRASSKIVFFNFKAMLLEYSSFDADVQRHERKCFRYGFADSNFSFRVSQSAKSDGYERGYQDGEARNS